MSIHTEPLSVTSSKPNNTDEQASFNHNLIHPEKNVWLAFANYTAIQSPFIESPSITSSVNNLGNIENQHSKSSKRQFERIAVRTLLIQLIKHLQINDTLDESEFPYRLQNSGYFVCFSHSAHGCAVILCKNHPVGIDIENRIVSWKVAKRYFHQNEIDFLNSQNSRIRSILTKQLWQIKECLIKLNKSTLFLGMNKDLSDLLPKLFNSNEHQIREILPEIMINQQLNQPYSCPNNQVDSTKSTILPVYKCANITLDSTLSSIWLSEKNDIVAIY